MQDTQSQPVRSYLRCSFWKNAVTMVPEFWTRVKILIDSPHFSASFVTSLLAQSRDLVIEKVDVSRSIWTAMNDESSDGRRTYTSPVVVLSPNSIARAIFFILYHSRGST